MNAAQQMAPACVPLLPRRTKLRQVPVDAGVVGFDFLGARQVSGRLVVMAGGKQSLRQAESGRKKVRLLLIAELRRAAQVRQRLLRLPADVMAFALQVRPAGIIRGKAFGLGEADDAFRNIITGAQEFPQVSPSFYAMGLPANCTQGLFDGASDRRISAGQGDLWRCRSHPAPPAPPAHADGQGRSDNCEKHDQHAPAFLAYCRRVSGGWRSERGPVLRQWPLQLRRCSADGLWIISVGAGFFLSIHWPPCR